MSIVVVLHTKLRAKLAFDFIRSSGVSLDSILPNFTVSVTAAAEGTLALNRLFVQFFPCKWIA
jgi:hypothetical protein